MTSRAPAFGPSLASQKPVKEEAKHFEAVCAKALDDQQIAAVLKIVNNVFIEAPHIRFDIDFLNSDLSTAKLRAMKGRLKSK